MKKTQKLSVALSPLSWVITENIHIQDIFYNELNRFSFL